MKADVELNLLGFYCPEPLFRTKAAMDKMVSGQVLKVCADDPAAEEDLKKWVKATGNRLIKTEKEGRQLIIYIGKSARSPLPEPE